MSIISCIGFFCLGLMRGDPLLTLPAALLCMSLLGFLPYNFHPARIFLGDAGSGFLGFMLGVMAIAATKGPCTAVRFAAPIGIIGIPVCDMAFAVVRRIKRGKSLVAGDRDHLYDMLLKKGLSQPKVWWLLCATQAAMVAVALYLLR
jgi:UDP-GlcNAc:undecaprenyl-phosphate GlcNAc-1-phosphate transferase